VIDTATNTVVGSPIPVGNLPFAVAITPDGAHAYIADIEDGVDVIATATNTVVDTIFVDVPEAVAIAPDGTHAYTLSTNPPSDNHVDETVSVIDTATNTVVSSLTIGPAVPILAYTIAVTPDGTGLYVPNALANSVSVISTASNTVTGSVAVGNGPVGVAFLPHASVPSSGKACNGLYNGTFKGNITVSAGQNCSFVAGGITGNVVVTGGNFAFANGLIGGSVGIAGASTFSLGPGTIIDGSLGIGLIRPGTTTDQICGVNVLHDFGVVGDASPLQIGSASPASCAGNTIGGNATIDVNTAAIGLYDNTVTGTLSCLANKSITGGGNTAKSKVGQCKAF
jgi:YVTN family beta-propeller protein